jgi:hypothetical protein
MRRLVNLKKYLGYVFCLGVITSIVVVVPLIAKFSCCKQWTWCDSMVSIVNLVGLLGGGFVYFQWRSQTAVKRAEFLESLIDKFNSDESKKILTDFDDLESAEAWLDSDKNRFALNSFLRFLSYICYLRQSDLIGGEEFAMFEAFIVRMLADGNIKEFMQKEIEHLKVGDSVGNPFCSLFEYAKSRLYDDVFYQEGKLLGRDGDCQQDAIVQDENGGETGVSQGCEISKDEFLQPTIIIRINRLWHRDITADALYEATRKWWRVRYDVAKDYEIALSVADGIVREVYKISEWRDCDGRKPDASHKVRLQFVGKVASHEIRDRFLNRRVDGLFKRGDAYPIRYFGKKEGGAK